MVLSGLNLGLNLGPATWHSGTLAAAGQTALVGVRAIALSIPASREANLTDLLPRVDTALDSAAERLPLVNVNLPRQPHWCDVDARFYRRLRRPNRSWTGWIRTANL